MIELDQVGRVSRKVQLAQTREAFDVEPIPAESAVVIIEALPGIATASSEEAESLHFGSYCSEKAPQILYPMLLFHAQAQVFLARAELRFLAPDVAIAKVCQIVLRRLGIFGEGLPFEEVRDIGLAERGYRYAEVAHVGNGTARGLRGAPFANKSLHESM